MPPRSMLGKLPVVADQDQLRAGCVGMRREHRHDLGVDHGGFVDHDDGAPVPCVRSLLRANSSLWIVAASAKAVALHVLGDGVGRREADDPVPRSPRRPGGWRHMV